MVASCFSARSSVLEFNDKIATACTSQKILPIIRYQIFIIVCCWKVLIANLWHNLLLVTILLLVTKLFYFLLCLSQTSSASESNYFFLGKLNYCSGSRTWVLIEKFEKCNFVLCWCILLLTRALFKEVWNQIMLLWKIERLNFISSY